MADHTATKPSAWDRVVMTQKDKMAMMAVTVKIEYLR
jgi:hypothetical protein